MALLDITTDWIILTTPASIAVSSASRTLVFSVLISASRSNIFALILLAWFLLGDGHSQGRTKVDDLDEARFMPEELRVATWSVPSTDWLNRLTWVWAFVRDCSWLSNINGVLFSDNSDEFIVEGSFLEGSTTLGIRWFSGEAGGVQGKTEWSLSRL